MLDLEGKVAVVTGGSSGIGRGIARRLAAAGCRIAVAGRDQHALDATAEALGGIGVRADVTDLADVRRLADRTLDRFGCVDIVVNNAGIGPVARMDAMTAADWKWILDANVWSVINGIQVFLPLLRQNAGGGHIVNTSSISGMFCGSHIGGYATSKFAVVALTETLAIECEEDGGRIGVSLFLPGPVRSNIHLSSRNRPAGPGGGLADAKLDDMEEFAGAEIPWMEPDMAGEIVVEGIRQRRLYIWTHPDGTAPILDRHRAIERSIEDARGALDRAARAIRASG